MQLTELRIGTTTELKNGATADLNVTYHTTKALHALMEEGAKGALALYELHQKAQKTDHVIPENFLPTLREYGFLGKDNQLDGDIRNIVLSAIEGEGGKIHIVPPVPLTAPIEIEGKKIIVSEKMIALVTEWVDLSTKMRPYLNAEAEQIVSGQKRTIKPERLTMGDRIPRLTTQIDNQFRADNPDFDFSLNSGKEMKMTFPSTMPDTRGEYSEEGHDEFLKQSRAAATIRKKALHEIFTLVCEQKGVEVTSPYQSEVGQRR